MVLFYVFWCCWRSSDKVILLFCIVVVLVGFFRLNVFVNYNYILVILKISKWEGEYEVM